MNGIEQAARLQAALVGAQRIAVKLGIVQNYNPDRYQAKVSLQPEQVLTGWLPISSQWVGAQWGLFMPPSIGQHVRVEFVEGHIDAGVITGMQFSNAFPPISVPSGSVLLQNAKGSLLQFNNDGDVNLISVGTLTTQASQWNHTGDVFMDGNLLVSGDVTDSTGATTPNTKTLADFRSVYDGHDHDDPEGGVVGTPNQLI